MATTVAHGLIGVSLYCAIRPLCGGQIKLPLNLKMLIAAGFVANIPDLDMIVSLLFYSDHRILHGGLSHTLFFAIISGAFVWLITKNASHRGQLSIAATLLLSSHVIVDFLTGPNMGFHPTHGAAIFWPVFESEIFSPVTIFKGVEHSQILPGALFTAFWEFIILAPVTAMIIYASNKNN